MFNKNTKKNEEPARRRRLEDTAGAEPIPATARSGTQFRRNQTLSSYRTTGVEGSDRQKAHSLALERRKMSGILILVASVVVFLGLLLWQFIAQVNVIASSQQLSRPFAAQVYEDSISEYLNVNPSQRLRFALNQEALSQYVAVDHPEVEAVALTSTPGIARGGFTITFRNPVAGWQISGTQHYVDQKGIVFEQNYYQSPSVQIVDESGIESGQGSAVVGSRLLGFLGRLVSQAEGRGYTVERAVLPEGKTREVDIHLKGISTMVKFVIDRGAGEQVEDMDRSLNHLKSNGISAGYVDVRVSGRAAYK